MSDDKTLEQLADFIFSETKGCFEYRLAKELLENIKDKKFKGISYNETSIEEKAPLGPDAKEIEENAADRQPTVTRDQVYQEIKAATAHGGITARKLSHKLGLSKDRGPVILAPILAKLCSHLRKKPDGTPIRQKVRTEYVDTKNHPYAIQELVYYVINPNG